MTFFFAVEPISDPSRWEMFGVLGTWVLAAIALYASYVAKSIPQRISEREAGERDQLRREKKIAFLGIFESELKLLNVHVNWYESHCDDLLRVEDQLISLGDESDPDSNSKRANLESRKAGLIATMSSIGGLNFAMLDKPDSWALLMTGHEAWSLTQLYMQLRTVNYSQFNADASSHSDVIRAEIELRKLVIRNIRKALREIDSVVFHGDLKFSVSGD